MELQEVKQLISEEVEAATNLLKDNFDQQLKTVSETYDKQLSDLEKSFNKKLEDAQFAAGNAEAKPSAPKATVIPDKVFTVGDLKVKFATPSFYKEDKLIITEAEVDNQALVEELVKNQTHKRYGFRDGVLKQVN